MKGEREGEHEAHGLEDAMSQKSTQLELPFEDRGEAPKVERSVEASAAPAEAEGSGASGVMGRALSRSNLFAALTRVRKNKGGPGIDGMTTPQGGPLSPLLANVLLDEVDKELEKRGHAFVRYADDCNVYVRSKRAGERVMAHMRRLFGKLRLRVNEAKSAVARAWERKFLGFTFWVARGRKIRRRVSSKSLVEMKERVRRLTRRNCGQSLQQVVEDLRPFLYGWRAYYGIAETPGVFADLDGWIRHRLRAIQLRQWKRGRTTYRELVARGVRPRTAAEVAANTRRWWRNSAMAIHHALPNRMFDELGLPRLAA